MEYIPGKDNVVADALSRWAYPVCKAFADVSIHGSAKDDADMQDLIKQEWAEERGCYRIDVREAINTLKIGVERKTASIKAGEIHTPKHHWEGEPDLPWLEAAIRGIRTRGGATTGPEAEESLDSDSDSDSESDVLEVPPSLSLCIQQADHPNTTGGGG